MMMKQFNALDRSRTCNPRFRSLDFYATNYQKRRFATQSPEKYENGLSGSVESIKHSIEIPQNPVMVAAMVTKGRILNGDHPITEMIEFDISEDNQFGDRKWYGNFQAPDDFSTTALPGGIGKLELANGIKADIYLLKKDAYGLVTFHCPGAPKIQ